MGKKHRKKQPIYKRKNVLEFFVFLVVNIVLVTLSRTVEDLEISFLCAKTFGVMFYGSIIFFIIKSIISSSSKKPNDIAFKWGMTIFFGLGIIFFIINYGTEMIDLFHEPTYIVGQVEDINDPFRGPTEVYLKDHDKIYKKYSFKIEIEEGERYRFRLMPTSRNVIAGEVLDNEIGTSY